jgi:hypothetical protein
MTMQRTLIVLAVGILCLSCPLHADYLVQDRGVWPDTWPEELESLREHARTLEGPLLPLLHYAIPFTQRDEFEAAWPHLLKVKTPGTPIILRRGPSFWLRDGAIAGVCIHTPPEGEEPAASSAEAGDRLERTIYIELIVDGEIVDLNRIPLPPDTPIVDERFPDAAEE